MAVTPNIRSLVLNEPVHEDELFVLQIGQTVHFCLGPTLLAHDIHLKCDYPQANQTFQRDNYHELDWICTHGNKHDPDRYASLFIERAGTFHFCYSTTDNDNDSLNGSGYIVAEPKLRCPLDGICCITHITKLLGPLTEWQKRLEVSYQAAYNMIHFTPIQQLGSSKSAYSIADQLSLCDLYLPVGYKPKNATVTYEDALGVSKDLVLDEAFTKVKKLVDDTLDEEWNMNCITDVIWSHTSCDSQWLLEHPDAAYNLKNSPHLRPAYVLDVTLKQFSDEVADGKWVGRGINATVVSEQDLYMIASQLMDNVLPKAKLWEYFCVDVESIVSEFLSQNKVKSSNESADILSNKSLEIIQDPKYRRNGSSINFDVAIEKFNESMLRQNLEYLNKSKEEVIKKQLQKATDNLVATLRYEFLDDKGPRRQNITKVQPLFSRYFYVLNDGNDLTKQEIEEEEEGGQYVVAHDGWTLDADPLVNFAAPGSLVYFQRELNVWNDSVKLRYGNSHNESPFLWDLMTRYTQINAWLFHGFRLHNCCNTPIHVAEELLAIARQVRPNLYVVAKLFTNSEERKNYFVISKERKNYFVNRLGINSFIEEAAHVAKHASTHTSTPPELCGLINQYGGTTIGSFFEPSRSPIRNNIRAMFFDATHDRDLSHIESRSVWNVLPNTALVSIAGCPVGSSRGYDELVPHVIDVRNESRPYTTWSSDKSENSVCSNSGIVAVKAELNRLHQKLAEDGYTQIYSDMVTDDVIRVERHCPTSHKSCYLIAHTAFWAPKGFPTKSNRSKNHCFIPPMLIPGVIDKVILEAKLFRDDGSSDKFIRPEHVISGLHGYHLDMQCGIPLENSSMCQLGALLGDSQRVLFNGFSVGSVLVLSVHLTPETIKTFQQLQGFIDKPLATSDPCDPYKLGKSLYKKLVNAVKAPLTLGDLNYILYRCDQEEHGSTYNIPGYGHLKYCGLQGILSVLDTVRLSNDLDHPLCVNLKKGNWLIDYTLNRLGLFPTVNKLADVVAVVLDCVKRLPSRFIPCYFDAAISVIHRELVTFAFSHMSQ